MHRHLPARLLLSSAVGSVSQRSTRLNAAVAPFASLAGRSSLLKFASAAQLRNLHAHASLQRCTISSNHHINARTIILTRPRQLQLIRHFVAQANNKIDNAAAASNAAPPASDASKPIVDASTQHGNAQASNDAKNQHATEQQHLSESRTRTETSKDEDDERQQQQQQQDSESQSDHSHHHQQYLNYSTATWRQIAKDTTRRFVQWSLAVLVFCVPLYCGLFLLRHYCCDVIRSTGPSMEPTLRAQGDYVLVQTWCLWWPQNWWPLRRQTNNNNNSNNHNAATTSTSDASATTVTSSRFQRGDVIVAQSPLAHQQHMRVCKRIVGLEGDVVQLHTTRYVTDTQLMQDEMQRLFGIETSEPTAQNEEKSNNSRNADDAPSSLGSDSAQRDDSSSSAPRTDPESDSRIQSHHLAPPLSSEQLPHTAAVHHTRYLRPVRHTEYRTISPGHVWLQGDNLSNSTDSRLFGQVPLELIKGRVSHRIWPLERAQRIPRTMQYSAQLQHAAGSSSQRLASDSDTQAVAFTVESHSFVPAQRRQDK